jgi:hypothetical protein
MFRSSMLLGGVILLAAIPVCADSVLYTASTSELSNPENAASTIRTVHTKFLVPKTANLISESLPVNTEAWAIIVPASDIAQDSTPTKTSGNRSRAFALAPANPENDARPSVPTAAILSINGSQSGGVFAFNGSQTSLVPSTLDPASAEFSTAGSRLGFFGNDPDHDRRGKGKAKNDAQDGPPVNVPEPGTLPLAALGLLAVAIIASRHRDFTTNG